MCSDQMSRISFGTLSSPDMWEQSSGEPAEAGQNYGEVFQAGFSGMVQKLNESQNHISRLESEVKALRDEKLKQEYQNQVHVLRLKDQIRILEQKAVLDLQELKRRQNHIEEEVPSLEAQIASLKSVLHDLNVSESLYSELIAIPKESRTIREHLLVLVYEKMLKHRNDLQSIQQERDCSREALSRANDEVQKLRRDIQRITTNDAIEKQAKDKEIEVLTLQNEHLEKELQNANLQVQVILAKGSMYDELREKIVQLEEVLLEKEKEKDETSKSLQNLSKQIAEYEKSLNDKKRCIEVLQMEKVYLNDQHKTLEEQLQNMESEKIVLKRRINELEECQKGFLDRILSIENSAQATREQLLYEEKIQLQERNKQELDMLRSQIAEAADFEIQMLRRTRDFAASERDKIQLELQETKAQNTELIERYNELKIGMMKISKLEEDTVSQREKELAKLQEKTYHDLCEAKIENKALTEKLETSMQNLNKVEGDMIRTLLDLKLKLESAKASLHHHEKEEHLFNEVLENAYLNCEDELHMNGFISTLQGKIELISTIFKKHKSLQQNLNALERERDVLKQQILESEEKVNSMNRKIGCMDQPTSSLVNTIEQMESKLEEAKQTNKLLESKLREAISDKTQADLNLTNLRMDLKRVVEARGNMDILRKILMEKDPNLGIIVSKKLAVLK
ncbi:hypothetical protein KP509_34G003400 [Ceratopteris richardii]|uniref:Uncharacterized protein n=1 Tax=Ceratopteris richardii TaxID=49495 RepID=A0A8T2QGU8_CERRI|nr:hypothetical protein KP509_34G003400 [Ceratopteris richardii]KAH7283363.1 hypothetical protein KP509_34G003400 [Ceratopteris richardii]